MRTGRPDHRDDDGAVVAVMPIFLMLVIVGLAALVGIAMQPSESAAAPTPVVTAAKLQGPCSEEVGPVPARAAQAQVWARAFVDCVESRMGDSLGSKLAQGNAGFRGVDAVGTFEGSQRFVIRWEGEAPPALLAWAARHPGGLLAVVQLDR